MILYNSDSFYKPLPLIQPPTSKITEILYPRIEYRPTKPDQKFKKKLSEMEKQQVKMNKLEFELEKLDIQEAINQVVFLI